MHLTGKNPAGTPSPMFTQSSLCGSGLVLAVVAALFQPANAPALGFRVPNQDAEATARGNAETATADNPSAIYYNPAGITQISGENLQVGLHVISINSTYTPQAPAPANGATQSKFAIQPVAQFYYTRALQDSPITLGLGMYAPYGLALQWPDDSQFHQNAAYFGQLIYLTINPVAAYKINEQFSIAAGPTVNYSQVLLREGIGAPGPGIKFRGEGYAFGATAGLMWKPCDDWSFGARYHSPTTMRYEGSASFQTSGNSSSAKVSFPQFFMAGASYRPNTNWNFEADVDWTDWSTMKSVTFNNVPVIGNTPQGFNWHSSVLLEIGATRYLDNGYFVSAGYFFSQKSTTDYNFTPIVPDTDLHVGSVGFGHKGKRWDYALSGQIITGPPRVVSNDANPTVDGKYQWMNGAVNFSICYHFR